MNYPWTIMTQSKGFYRWAWDIIVGCKHGCPYCYAAHKKNFTTPRFNEYLLNEPYKIKPAMIFVNWLGDIMGEWVPAEWIEKILKVANDLPEHTFLFMTKNPKRYAEFTFPGNCLIGVTVETPDSWDRVEIMSAYKDRKMCSVEPIMGDFTGKDFSQFELVVVGSLIGSNSHEYYETVKHSNIYYTR